ncbi:hemin uptake protein HemP [Ideonella sp.]|uniref:hemin uptake protein HemP n=1 Tax=Ideonella sp. TaxID=1929293 RepID=UPI002B4777EF|nr:hemin uptake protein HemP [Ideonella sp.]HJV71172.1 hemin uptake protein HemP [Ideonella sp.]
MPVPLPPPGLPEPLPADPPAIVAPVTASSAGGPQWRSEDLLAGTDEALITHGDQVYRLRRTGTGKLILTK